MIRTATAVKPRTRPASYERPVPAPVGGLNAINSIADMPAQDALVLDNFFPQPDYVELRRGHASHATGLSAAVEALMEWNGPGSQKLFAATGSRIYPVTSSGSPSSDVSSLSSGQWQHVMQATSGGNFLVICNGTDAVHNYDGTSWTTPTINNVTSSDLIGVSLHKERLWFIEINSLNAWYLATQAISGDATKFPLGSVFKHGGHLVAIGTISRDGGVGPDDYCAFISSTGECVIYAGTDPSDSSTWAQIGSFSFPPPIGYRCTVSMGGDLGIITEGGIISVSAAQVLDRSAQQKAAITSKINRLFTADARNYRSNTGWQVLSYRRSNMVIVNVPVAAGSSQRQYVMNGLTGGWCRFTGMNAGCWGLLNGDLFFGGNSGTVFKADSGFQDNGSAIQADLKTSFNDFGVKGRVKMFKMLRALFASNGSPGFLMDLNVDYEDRPPTSTPTAGAAPMSVWGSATWGVSKWTSGQVLTRQWVGAAGIGHSAAIRLRVNSNGASCTVNGFDVVFEAGGFV